MKVRALFDVDINAPYKSFLQSYEMNPNYSFLLPTINYTHTTKFKKIYFSHSYISSSLFGGIQVEQ